MNASVRRAEIADANEIAACLAALGYGTPPALVAERMRAFAESTVDAVFVVGGPSGAPLLGVASAHLLPLFHAPGHLARLTALAVRTEAQGRGAGRALVAAVETWAWSRDARRVEVTSGDHRAGAHALYQALGYALDERRFLKHAPDVPRGSRAGELTNR